jgi:hypothetical protein
MPLVQERTASGNYPYMHKRLSCKRLFLQRSNGFISKALCFRQDLGHSESSPEPEMCGATLTQWITVGSASGQTTSPSLFCSRGCGHELANTLEWVLGVLEHRAYLDGTRYYDSETAECFLFFSRAPHAPTG